MTRLRNASVAVLVSLSLAAGLLPTPAVAQVSTPAPAKICRKLAAGDKWFPEYRSCCDIDGGRSRWEKADGSATEFTSVCALWGITPGAPAQALKAPTARKASTGGIPPGRYACQLGSPVDITIAKDGSYRSADGSRGRFSLAAREQDAIGGYARYAISGGSFGGFFFLHRDNGQLQVGNRGWGRCEPR